MHQGDVGPMQLVDKSLMLDDAVHLVTFLRRGNVRGRAQVVLTQTHAPEGGSVHRAGKGRVRTWDRGHDNMFVYKYLESRDG